MPLECVSFHVIPKLEKLIRVQFFEFFPKKSSKRHRQNDEMEKCEFRAKYEYVCTDFDCVTELCSQVSGVNMRLRISTSVSTYRSEHHKRMKGRRRKETIAARMKKESVARRSVSDTNERRRIENEIEN